MGNKGFYPDRRGFFRTILESSERRLGAIMFTDLVGYSAMTSRNEELAPKMLEEHRTLLREAFRKHSGVVIKTVGDGFLVEFASAVEPVNSAVEAQAALRHFNEGRKEKVSVRIGIHVGDIVHSGGDILGDAVNVAARLQPLAEPGGICVSRHVVDQIERKVPYVRSVPWFASYRTEAWWPEIDSKIVSSGKNAR